MVVRTTVNVHEKLAVASILALGGPVGMRLSPSTIKDMIDVLNGITDRRINGILLGLTYITVSNDAKAIAAVRGFLRQLGSSRAAEAGETWLRVIGAVLSVAILTVIAVLDIAVFTIAIISAFTFFALVKLALYG